MEQEEIILEIRQGKTDQFEKLLNDFKNMIANIVNTYKYDIGDYKVDYDDLYQEGYLALYDACLKFKDDKGMRFSSYAYLLIRSRIINAVRSDAKIRRNEFYSYDRFEKNDWNRNLASTYVCEDPIKYQNEEFERLYVKRFMDSLSKEDQTILKMRANKRSYKQIAKDLNINVKKIDNRLRYIRNAYKEYEKKQRNLFNDK